MRKKTILALLASVMLVACQKTDTSKSENTLPIKNPDALIIAAKSFFNNNFSSRQSSLPTNDPETLTRQHVNKTPVWEKAYIVNDNGKGQMVYVPLRYDAPLHFKTSVDAGKTFSLEEQSILTIYKDALGNYRAVVVINLPDKAYLDDRSKSFSGYLLEEDWNGNSIGTYLYKNGSVSLLKKNPLRLTKNESSREGDICYVVNWYSCDNIVNGTGYNCQLLFSEYIPCEGGGDDDDEGGGGGGYGYNQNDFCSMTGEQAQSALNSVTTSIYQDGISTIGQETAPDVDGIIKKPVLVTRHKIKYEFPGGTTATYTLFFPGVIFKTTTNSVWKWESLIFDKIARTEGGNPACLAASVSASVSLVISTDKTKADFVAEVKADLQVSCLGGWILKTKSDPLDGTYYAYEFQ